MKAAHKLGNRFDRTTKEHWSYLRDALKLEAERTDLERRVAKRAISDFENADFEQVEGEHLSSDNEELLERVRDAEKICETFIARQYLHSFAGAKDLRATRAAFVTLLSSMKETKPCGKRGSFVAELGKEYGKEIRPGIVQYVWTPIYGWAHRVNVKAVQIFPLQYGQATMDYVFGKDAYRELNNALNGLFLSRDFKDRFDKYQVIIVPFDTHSDPPEYKWLVLNRNLLDTPIITGWMTYGDIHEKKLIFRTDFRPRARYLYFHYLEAIRHHSKTLRNDQPKIDFSELTNAWCRSGSYIRENMIRAFIEDCGNDINDDDKERIREHSSIGIQDDEIEQITKAVGELTFIPEDSDSDYELKEDSGFE